LTARSPALRRRRRERATPARREEQRIAWTMIAPTLLVILVVAFVPVVYTIYLSLHDSSVTQTGAFVGLENFSTLLDDPAFHRALLNTVVFTIASVGIELVVGLAVASVLNQSFRGRGLARAAVLVPWAFPVVVTGLIFRLMLQDEVGILSSLAHGLGLIDGPILSDPTALMISMVGVDVWASTPFMALLLLAGLQTIPDEVMEAARMDGASALQRFFRITLPLLKGPLLVALLFRTLQSWSVYDLFWVMAQRQLDSLSTYVYTGVRISELQFAPGTAAAVFVFATSILIAAVFIAGFGVRTTDEER
jgi:ABC-type sugar transport system permease subunit